jgi:hypothetical protein
VDKILPRRDYRPSSDLAVRQAHRDTARAEAEPSKQGSWIYRYEDGFAVFEEAAEPDPRGTRHRVLTKGQLDALAILNLKKPPSSLEVKARYKELVKRFSPDSQRRRPRHGRALETGHQRPTGTFRGDRFSLGSRDASVNAPICGLAFPRPKCRYKHSPIRMEARMSLSPNGSIAAAAPDMTVDVRNTFGLDVAMTVPAFSKPNEYVPDFDPAYVFDRENHARRFLQASRTTGAFLLTAITAPANRPCRAGGGAAELALRARQSRFPYQPYRSRRQGCDRAEGGKQVTNSAKGFCPGRFKHPVC